MLIFKDALNGDEMMSDIFKFTLEYDEVIMKVQSQYKDPDKVGEIDVGCGNEFGGAQEEEPDPNEDKPEKVIDIVYNANLKEYTLSKKEFMAFIKEFFKKVVEYLEKNGKSDRVATFKKGATEFIKFIMPHFDDLTIYIGNNGETEDGDIAGGIAISYWEKEDAKGPVFFFFKDALKEEKC